MPQATHVLPTAGPLSMAAWSAFANSALAALISQNSGATAPAVTGQPAAFQFWLDTSTTPNTLRIYDGAAWAPIGLLDITAHTFVPPDGVVSNAKLANMATATIKGRTTAGTGTPQDLTASQALDVLGVSAFARTVLDDADAYTARTTLGLAWEQIALDAVTNVASWSAINLSAYRLLRLTLKLRPATSDAYINFRTSSNNGTSYDAGATDYGTINIIGSGSAATSGQSSEPSLSMNGSGGTDPQAAVHRVELFDFNKATSCFIQTQGFTLTGANAKGLEFHGAMRVQSTARNAIQITMSSGNIATGVFLLEGVRG